MKTREEIVEAVSRELAGVEVGGVTFSTSPTQARLRDGYWQVEVTPSAIPPRMYPIYEELALVEERLHDKGFEKFLLSVGDPALAVVA